MNYQMLHVQPLLQPWPAAQVNAQLQPPSAARAGPLNARTRGSTMTIPSTLRPGQASQRLLHVEIGVAYSELSTNTAESHAETLSRASISLCPIDRQAGTSGCKSAQMEGIEANSVDRRCCPGSIYLCQVLA
jgi:hypothetical protein